MTPTLITVAAYQFIRLENLERLRQEIKSRCVSWNLKGTVLLAAEGLNSFVCGRPEEIAQFRNYLVHELGMADLCYKEHPCAENPFTRLLVKIKKEIISMGDPSIRPDAFTGSRLSPKELKSWLDEGKEVVLLDTRNDYEIASGTFANAIHLGLSSFREFPEAAQKLPEELKEKVVVMFCTGGIRCEKASAYFMKNGYQHVYQLQGGILKYFEECQDAHYEGTCFVFDWRLCVDSQLKPSPRTGPDSVNAGRHKIIDRSRTRAEEDLQS